MFYKFTFFSVTETESYGDTLSTSNTIASVSPSPPVLSPATTSSPAHMCVQNQAAKSDFQNDNQNQAPSSPDEFNPRASTSSDKQPTSFDVNVNPISEEFSEGGLKTFANLNGFMQYPQSNLYGCPVLSYQVSSSSSPYNAANPPFSSHQASNAGCSYPISSIQPHSIAQVVCSSPSFQATYHNTKNSHDSNFSTERAFRKVLLVNRAVERRLID